MMEMIMIMVVLIKEYEQDQSVGYSKTGDSEHCGANDHMNVGHVTVCTVKFRHVQ
jgi:hypothetical protein